MYRTGGFVYTPIMADLNCAMSVADVNLLMCIDMFILNKLLFDLHITSDESNLNLRIPE